jgi:hypothetical protein
MPAAERPKSVCGCEVWRGLDWMMDGEKVAHHVAAHENLAAALNGVFDSQIAGGKRYDLATLGRRRANATFFESHAVDECESVSFAMDLTQRTRSDNAHFFKSENEVPHHVITMGIGTILEAKAVLLLAFGDNKAEAVAGAVEGPITASNPASILQMHPTAKLYLDEKSASKLARRDYYCWVFENKPGWQRD